MTSPRQLAALSALAFSLVLLSGCGGNSTATSSLPPPPPPPPVVEPDNCKSTHTTSPAPPAPTLNIPGPAITGVVKAGQQPIAGSQVSLYAAGTQGNGSTPTVLLSTPALTDANGAFSIAAGFVCPSSDSVLYAVARNGTGATAGVDNLISLATVLGGCGSLQPATAITLNEATTVATAYAMSQFIDANNIGASSTNTSGLLLAAATAANLVNTTTGIAPGLGFPSTGEPPTAKLNSLANALNACIVTPLGSPTCSSLYAASGSDPFSAAVAIAQHPGANISTLYTLSRASNAYSPTLTTAPADWTLAVNFRGGGLNAPSAVAVDSTGKLWVANYYNIASLFTNTGEPVFPHGVSGGYLNESFGGAVDVDDNFWALDEQTNSINNGLGAVSVVNGDGGFNGVYSAGGVNFPLGIAFDTSGIAWVVDYGDSSITLLDPTGNPLSGAAGYSSKSLVFPVAVATDAKCNAYVANQSSNTVTRVLADGSEFTDFTVGDGPSGVAIDAGGNIWSANYYGDSIGLVSATGTVLSGSGYKGGGILHPQGIAADGNGNLWVANYLNTALSELAGVSVASGAPAPGTILSPTAGWAPDSGLAKAFGLAIDASGNIWITNFATNRLTEFVGLAAPVQTPQLGPVRIP